VTTRNARLAAVHSLFRYAALRAPEHAALIARVLAIPAKRSDRAIISYLTQQETSALLAAPDQATWAGRRDHAPLQTAVQTGLRVSELTSLRCQDVHLGPGAHVRCHGKGRKERCTPLTASTIKTLRRWLAERAGQPDGPLFCTRPGRPFDVLTWRKGVAPTCPPRCSRPSRAPMTGAGPTSTTWPIPPSSWASATCRARARPSRCGRSPAGFPPGTEPPGRSTR
jgi:integrase